jgi:hypothetical protein
LVLLPLAACGALLSALPSPGTTQLSAGHLADRIQASLDTTADQPGARDAIDLFAWRFADRFTQWRASVMVSA